LNDYEQKKQARIDRYRGRAAKAGQQSDQLYTEARKMGEAIPLGQPMLVDHYSYKSDRNYRERMGNKYTKAFEASDKAAHYEAKAQAAESNNAISSDDPEAIPKLKARLAEMQDYHAFMVRFNRHYKKHGTCKGFEDISDEDAEKTDTRIKAGYSWNQQPFPAYTLQNDNQNIKRVKERIATLERNQDVGFVGWDFPGGHVVANTEENRLQIYFDDKPDEDKRKAMKAHGFHYSKYNNHAWQRQLNGNAIRAAGYLPFVLAESGVEPYKLQPGYRRQTEKKDAPGPVR